MFTSPAAMHPDLYVQCQLQLSSYTHILCVVIRQTYIYFTQGVDIQKQKGGENVDKSGSTKD